MPWNSFPVSTVAHHRPVRPHNSEQSPVSSHSIHKRTQTHKMKYTVAAVVLMQALPALSGGIYQDSVLSGIETCDPLSNDAHIGRASCESGFECIADEASELGGSCISLAVIEAIAAAAVRDLQEFNFTLTNFTNSTNETITDDVIEEASDAPTPYGAGSSASVLSMSALVSMVGLVTAWAWL